ncbi:breast cancer anti-estrogen resistance protein 3 homolog [Ctenocephalides felis]|uniref:breast cancer anti-estrogen resistance protein 3 homolog n=1 Tax=Ctenocephalides felis TaxID=7515 RepID=UPI000E6E58D5|nr:breast cancer anti-estrogen resistance protein 3 homolog [Ctenocephalides felis]
MQYDKVFDDVKGVEDLLNHSEADLTELGIKNSAHRAAMASSLVILKAKLERGNNNYKKHMHMRHSVALDDGSKKNVRSEITPNCDTKQTKSLCNLIMDTPVEKTQSSPRELRIALEQELSLDARDLRSHGWYHGPIPRARAERLLVNDGDFLVRDCSSQPGDYVLSCKSKGTPLHFVINKVLLQPETVYERLQYRFEDDAYDTVPDLITYYVGSGTHITSASGARIQFPCNRTQPLSHYSTQYTGVMGPLPGVNPYTNRHCGQPPRLPMKKQRDHEKANSADGIIRATGGESFNTHSLPRSRASRSPRLDRRKFEVPDECDEIYGEAPPKPCRMPTSSLPPRASNYQASGSDSGNGSGDSAQSSATGDSALDPNHRNSGVVIKNPHYIVSSASSTTLKNFVEFDAAAAEERLAKSPTPELRCDSRFDVESFHTLLLPATENKPLDVNALRSVLDMLVETGSRIIANYLTKVDIDFMLGVQEDNKENIYLDALRLQSGLELICLPHGHQFRLDLIERTECLKLMVAVTILTCASDLERAAILHKWIQIAIDTKTALGNLYGFCGIMLGLSLPQIQKLEKSWHILRQRHTDSAFQFEAKLRPTLKAMNEGHNPQAPNTTIPHVLPIALLMERDLDDFQVAINSTGFANSCLASWEQNSTDFGLTTLIQHMQAARSFAPSVATFRRIANSVLQEIAEEDISCDAFRTEFHQKFLWGSKGATLSAEERHSKFDQILTIMSDKCIRDIAPNSASSQ